MNKDINFQINKNCINLLIRTRTLTFLNNFVVPVIGLNVFVRAVEQMDVCRKTKILRKVTVAI